jgi:hypothetical protein
MSASSSTLRPATLGQGLLFVLVGTGMSVDLKIGGSPPPPARSEIHRSAPMAVNRSMECPKRVEQRGNMAWLWWAGRGWIKAICRATSTPPLEGPVTEFPGSGQ